MSSKIIQNCTVLFSITAPGYVLTVSQEMCCVFPFNHPSNVDCIRNLISGYFSQFGIKTSAYDHKLLVRNVLGICFIAVIKLVPIVS